MKKEKSVEREHNKTEYFNKLDNSESNKIKVRQEKEGESALSRNKKEGEITNSLALSLDLLDKDYSQQVKENPTDNSNFQQVPYISSSATNLGNLQPSHFSAFDRSSSPFLVDVHRLSFNNMEFNFPTGRALYFTNNNFESPYVIKTHTSQLSSSPLTIKISNSIKNLHEYEKDANNNDFSCNSFLMGNQGSGILFNSHSNSNFNQNIYNGDLNFYNANNKNLRRKQTPKIKENLNILKLLDNENQKELLEKDKLKIKLSKNEKLIKSIFERKEESLTNSEENSRKILSMRISSKLSQLDSENINLAHDPSSNLNTNLNFNHSRLRIDPSKLLNNITYTLNNVNTDLNMGYRKNYSFSDLNYLSNQNNFHSIKPRINANFMKEEIEKINKLDELTNKEASLEMQIQQDANNKFTCNCKKSKCLKLYCDCFANEGYCQNCNCVDCHNLEDYESEREKVIQSIKEKNPGAFKPKIGLINNNLLKHTKGCNCTKSNCKKKYCECFQTGIECSDLCRCRDCKNVGRNKLNSYTLAMNDNIGLNNQYNETSENASISFIEKNRKDSKSICNYQIESESICLNSKPTVQNSNLRKINVANNSYLGSDLKSVFNQNALKNDFTNHDNSLKSKNNKINTKSLNPKSRFTERKRGRKTKITSKSQERSKSLNKKDKDIVQMINNLNKACNLSKNLPQQSLTAQPIATPKKNSKLIIDNNSNNIMSNHKYNSHSKKNIIKTYEKKYRDSTLTHIVTTAPTTSKKRTSTIFNKKDFDKNIVKKLNMNVNNEPLFDLKNK